MPKNHSNSKDKQEFYPGIRVKIADMRSVGEIMEGPNRKGQFRVSIGALSIWIESHRLCAIPVGKLKKQRKQRPSFSTPPAIDGISVDFHGLTVAQAIEAAEAALDRALIKNANKIELIHGIGSGKLRSAIQRYMNNSPHVKRCEIDPNNPGTSWAYLGSTA